MKTKNLTTKILLTFFLFLLSIVSFAQWNPQISGTTHSIHSVCFTDTLNGWASGGWFSNGHHGFILHTEDGGETWEEQLSGIDDNLFCIYFTNSTHGWAVGEGYESSFYRTINGGITWEEMESLDYANGIYFADSLNGWITLSISVGPGGVYIGHILHTNNGGETWEIQSEVYNAPRSVCFTDSLNGWISGGYASGSTGNIHGFILHTNDGGTNWEYQFDYSGPGYEGYILYDICFTDSQHGWSVGGGWLNQGGIILKTTDGGNNWDTSYIDTSYWTDRLYAISFANQFNGWAVGEGGRIISTTDGGNSWESESSGTGHGLTSVYFTENGHGWAVGGGGTILYANYSQTVGMNVSESQSLNSSLRCYPNPFSASTTIEYELKQAGSIQISIYNHLGERLELIQQTQSSGKQQLFWNAERLPPGVYFCVLKTNPARAGQTTKITKL